MSKYSLINAKERHTLHPETFEVPDEDALMSLKPNKSIKIGVEFDNVHPEIQGKFEGTIVTGERFWVTITDVVDNLIIATIDNHLVHTDKHGLKYQDVLVFSKDYVLTI